MAQAYFNNLADHICSQLSKAKNNISAAVCWFSQADIFDVLIDKLRAGVRVELLLEYDSQNIRVHGLDFQHFINQGGALFAHCDAGLMHHKFAIVDHNLLLTGSFNWTYNSNAENLLVTEDPSLVADFQREFERQKSTAKRIFTVKNEAVKSFSTFPIFENTNIQKVDLRKKIAGGCVIWMVRSYKMKLHESRILQEYLLPFDPNMAMAEFWNVTRCFDKKLFEMEWESFSGRLSAAQRRALRLFTCRMQPGDIVLMAGKKKELRAIGVIQSEPKRYESEGYSSARAVQWLKILPAITPVYLEKKGYLPAVGLFRGSGLRLLQEIFEKADLV